MPKHRPLIPNAALRQARIERCWSQELVAERIGTNAFTVSRWERGYAVPGLYYRQKLIELFAQPPGLLGLLPPGALLEPTSLPLPPDATSVAAPPVASPLSDPLLPSPLRLSTGLIGREALLTQIKGRLLVGRTPVLLAVQGLPGVGKTALVLALARDEEVRAHFADGILWAGLGQTPHVQETLARWGTLLGLAPTETARLTTSQAWAQALRTVIGSRRILIVLDDAWQVEDVLACQVGGESCAYLVTTRRSDLALQVAGADLAVVPELEEAEGLALLALVAPQVVEAEPEAARALVRAVGGLPLGLLLMGQHLRISAASEQPRRIRVALERLYQVTERLHLALPQAPLSAHPSLPLGTPLSLQASIGLSVSALSEPAQAMLSALALFPPKPNSFSEEAALEVSAGEAATLDALADAGLVESASPGRYRIHQTIADSARLQAADPAAAQRLAAFYADLLAEERPDSLLELEFNNLRAALEVAEQAKMPRALIQIIHGWFSFLERRGFYALAETYLTGAETVARTISDQVHLAQTLQHLGWLKERQGDYAQAETSLVEGLALARQAGLPAVACRALRVLGVLRERRGDYLQADARLQEALHLARQGQEPEVVAMVLTSLGLVAIQQSTPIQAEAYLREALEIARQFQLAERMSVVLHNLGYLASKQGDLAQQETYYQEALALARHHGYLGRVSEVLGNLCVVAQQRGDLARAETYAREVLSLARQCGYGESIGQLLLNLASLLMDRGDYQQAAISLHEGVALTRQTGFRELLGALLATLGTLAGHLGEQTQAEAAFAEALAIAEAINNRHLLTYTLNEQGAYFLAIQHPQRAASSFGYANTVARADGDHAALAAALYGQARAEALEGHVPRAAHLGRQSLNLYEARGDPYASEVNAWLAALPARGSLDGVPARKGPTAP
jgi:tetratricopeptide (TPR) repeat protein/transcriptional regulator with XRE-family HTH domain